MLIDSKQMLLYAVPPGNSLASSLVNDEDAQTCLIAVALTSRRCYVLPGSVFVERVLGAPGCGVCRACVGRFWIWMGIVMSALSSGP